MTYPPAPGEPDDDSDPSLHKGGQPSSESTGGRDHYPPPFPGGDQYPGEPNPYAGPQYGDQQYRSFPPGAPQYANPPYGPGPYGTPSYGQQPFGIPVATQTNGKAIGALVCGIAGLILCVIAGIPAIILGNMAVAEIEASGGRQSGRGMAVAGRVLGWIGVGLLILLLVVVLIVVVAAAASS